MCCRYDVCISVFPRESDKKWWGRCLNGERRALFGKGYSEWPGGIEEALERLRYVSFRGLNSKIDTHCMPNCEGFIYKRETQQKSLDDASIS